ncbi:MAG: sulfite exporter TauE/SafE family protein [Candidatus Acidiferrales bacterium]
MSRGLRDDFHVLYEVVGKRGALAAEEYGLAPRVVSCGSLPGALAGIGLLALLHSRWGEGVNHFLRSLIGVLLVTLPLLALTIDRFRARSSASPERELARVRNQFAKSIAIGLVGGFLVGLTSVGEGSVIILLLLIFLRRTPSALVATDIFHGMVLSAVLGVLHLRMGTADLRMVALLMTGSVFGVLIGSRLTAIVPAVWLRRTVLALLIPVGIMML